MFCGQLQCTAGEEKPYFVDYGTQYQQILLNDKICRLVASLCVTAPDGFLLFCIVCFKDRKDSGKERWNFFRKNLFMKRKEKLYKEMANCLKKKGEIVAKGETL